MIESIKNYYHNESCLTVPLKKYQAFFSDKVNASEGCAKKVALRVIQAVLSIFAHPILGLLAAVGVGIKALTCRSVQAAVKPVDMTLEQIEDWASKATVEEWNETQVARMRAFIKDPKARLKYHRVAGQVFNWVGHIGAHQANQFDSRTARQYHQAYCRPVGSTPYPGEPATEMVSEAIAEGISQVTTQYREKVRIYCVYECGGPHDPNQKGAVYIYVRGFDDMFNQLV